MTNEQVNAQQFPTVSERVCNEVMEWLRARENMDRPPLATAKFLVFCVKLHQRGEPLPPRREVAEHLGVSVAFIDTVLSQRTATGDITVELRVTPGFPERALSTKRHRMVIPSEKILRLVTDLLYRDSATDPNLYPA